MAVVDLSSAPAKARPPRDPGRTQAAILSAATQEFSRFGLGGARVDRIAVRAKTNKRMLYYYFGNKETLFLAVLEAAYARIRAAETKLSLLDVEPGNERAVAAALGPRASALLADDASWRARGSFRIRSRCAPPCRSSASA